MRMDHHGILPHRQSLPIAFCLYRPEPPSTKEDMMQQRPNTFEDVIEMLREDRERTETLWHFDPDDGRRVRTWVGAQSTHPPVPSLVLAPGTMSRIIAAADAVPGGPSYVEDRAALLDACGLDLDGPRY